MGHEGQRLTMFAQQRNLPARGFRPSVMLAVMGGVMVFGFWKVGKGIREQKYVFFCHKSRLEEVVLHHTPYPTLYAANFMGDGRDCRYMAGRLSRRLEVGIGMDGG